MTLGEDRVRIEFNPSANDRVTELKRMIAEFIDACHVGMDQTDDPEIGRLWSLAMTTAEDAAMWAVKAATAK